MKCKRCCREWRTRDFPVALLLGVPTVWARDCAADSCSCSSFCYCSCFCSWSCYCCSLIIAVVVLLLFFLGGKMGDPEPTLSPPLKQTMKSWNGGREGQSYFGNNKIDFVKQRIPSTDSMQVKSDLDNIRTAPGVGPISRKDWHLGFYRWGEACADPCCKQCRIKLWTPWTPWTMDVCGIATNRLGFTWHNQVGLPTLWACTWKFYRLGWYRWYLILFFHMYWTYCSKFIRISNPSRKHPSFLYNLSKKPAVSPRNPRFSRHDRQLDLSHGSMAHSVVGGFQEARQGHRVELPTRSTWSTSRCWSATTHFLPAKTSIFWEIMLGKTMS